MDLSDFETEKIMLKLLRWLKNSILHVYLVRTASSMSPALIPMLVDEKFPQITLQQQKFELAKTKNDRSVNNYFLNEECVVHSVLIVLTMVHVSNTIKSW